MPLFDFSSLVDLHALVDQEVLTGLGEYLDVRLLALQAVLATAGASVILWHAILTYDIFPAPYPPHPPRIVPARPSSAEPRAEQFPTAQSAPSTEASVPSARLTSTVPIGCERLLKYRAIPLDVARRRVRELGGLHATARRLQMSTSTTRRLLASERPLPPWVLNTLFDDWQSDERLRPSNRRDSHEERSFTGA